MISNQRFAALERACAPWGNDDVKKPKCMLELAAANSEIGNFDVYNIYDTCAGDTTQAGGASSSSVANSQGQWDRTLAEWNEAMAQEEVDVANDVATPAHPQLIRHDTQSPQDTVGAALNDYPCGGDRATRAWLNTPGVYANDGRSNPTPSRCGSTACPVSDPWLSHGPFTPRPHPRPVARQC